MELESTNDIIDTKGLSVLIPIYNQFITLLIKDLSIQATAIDFPIEIICLDDGSDPPYKIVNRVVKSLALVQYEELPLNIGRSKIRNLLSTKASYNNMLFLDCDSGIIAEEFLKTYLKYIGKCVVVGGRQYSPMPPINKDFYLHWYVGTHKEPSSAATRNKAPHNSLMFNNILIDKNIYSTFLLDETISTYGHEDTKFGIALRSKSISVVHIDNPVLHKSLDSTEDFITKTIQGVINFNKIMHEGMGGNTSLEKSYKALKMLKLTNIFSFTFTLFLKKKILRNLHSQNPSLYFFDLLKLHVLVQQNSKEYSN